MSRRFEFALVRIGSREAAGRRLLAKRVRAREEIDLLQLGRFTPRFDLRGDSWQERITSGRHHMGTTRMGGDPATSVVDAHCRVHPVENLFVAGSSVFPTYGWANPTLTIVALAVRLADYLAGRGGVERLGRGT